MRQQIFDLRTILGLIAILIVTGTVFYSDYLADKIAREERQKVQQWVEAGQFLINAPAESDTKLPSLILNEQTSIPIIETDEKDSIINWVNLDSGRVEKDSLYLKNKLESFKRSRPPVEMQIGDSLGHINRYYYGHSVLLQEVRYYPMIQLLIVALFILIIVLSLQLRNKSVQNQVWAGMAKETAHQLGTPVSSLQGWVEMLKENGHEMQIATEMEKDVERLILVSDRFGKIGSTPKLIPTDLATQIKVMTDYMKRRASDKIHFNLTIDHQNQYQVPVSPQLFDWVIENLLKNALDAMEGTGRIDIRMTYGPEHVLIDISDTGKGIPRSLWHSIFKPGFTTKKRGWGLGLSLSKRIVDDYHRGHLSIKHSELSKGTTFSIKLPREEKRNA
jgi:signal transduction histidine kinase